MAATLSSKRHLLASTLLPTVYSIQLFNSWVLWRHFTCLLFCIVKKKTQRVSSLGCLVFVIWLYCCKYKYIKGF
jgi:hypothetical protein